MRWFFPSWNGDFRFEEDPKHENVTILEMHEPTVAEQGALESLGKHFHKQKWVAVPELWDSEGDQKHQRLRIAAPLSKLGPAMAKVLKSGKQTLTAIKFKDGKVETVSGTDAKLDRFAEKASSKDPEGAGTAVTVKRPTPSCPQCHAGAIEPATEVLLSFLTEEQHRQWAERRSLICYGGRTGYPYLLAHRHSPAAKRMGRICCDLKSRIVVHFHDMTVPPEEEVLAAMLCLQHREHWLRNEATMLTPIGSGDSLAWACGLVSETFKNPFGDVSDGVEDAGLTQAIGALLMAVQGKVPEA